MKKVAIIVVLTLLVFLIGVGVTLLFIFPPSMGFNNSDNTYIYSTNGSFLTNLKSGGYYIKADIIIEVSEKNILRTLEKNNHRIRDQIIEILGNIEEEDIKQHDFKENLRNLIKRDLQNILKTDKIKGIYFNEFIVQ